MLKVLQINAMNNGNTGFIAENIKTKCIDTGIECRNAYGYTKKKKIYQILTMLLLERLAVR